MRHPFINSIFVFLAFVVLGVPNVVNAQSVITRGEAIGASPVVDLTQALRSVHRYSDQTVVLEGAVKRVCQMKGCWMELMPKGADRGIRVTFKDYAFFVPTDSTGFEENVFSKSDADHLIAEGVTLQRNADGTATEVSFVAQAVELRQ